MAEQHLAYAIGAVLFVAAIFLMTRRWFWLLLFGLCALASLFACLASIFHFQILAAVGFFALAVILFLIAGKVAE